MRAVLAENIAYTSWFDNMFVDQGLNVMLPLPSFFQIYSTLDCLINNIFQCNHLKPNNNNYTYFPQCTIFAPINNTVNSLIANIVGLFAQDKEVLQFVDSTNLDCECPSENKVLIKMLQMLQPHSVPAGKLKVNLSCLLIMMQNLRIKHSICNSTPVSFTGIY
jgi:hypothetical protein